MGPTRPAERKSPMSLSSDVPDDVPELAIPSEAPADEAEASRCLEEAARMVQDFAAAGAPAALTALLPAAEEPPSRGVEQALSLAKTVTQQTRTLHDEVARFLATTRNS